MKKNIHPQFHTNATITCACGNVFQTGSTSQNIHTEICSNCHPFYTGKQNLVDTAGVVEKFKKKVAIAAEKHAASRPKKIRKERNKK